MVDTYINRQCEYYDWGNTAPREYGAFCSKKKCGIEDAECGNCIENHKQEIKYELLFILGYAINSLENSSDHDGFMCPNGSLWTYDEVRNKLREYIK